MNGVVEMQRLKDREAEIKLSIRNINSRFGGLWREMEQANGQEHVQTQLTQLTQEVGSLHDQLREISIQIGQKRSEALAKPRQLGGTRKGKN
jgi:hypothetical protein